MAYQDGRDTRIVMRVLLVSATADSMVHFRLPLIRALVARRHEVHVRCAVVARHAADRIEREGATIDTLHRRDPRPPFLCSASSFFDPRATGRTLLGLLRACRALRPDVVVAYTHRMVALTAPIARCSGVPRVVGVITGLGMGRASRHSWRERGFRHAFDASLRFALRSCDAAVVLNHDDLDEVLRRGLTSAGKLHLIDGEGLDPAWFQAPVRSPFPPGGATFLMVGRLLKSKGVETFVDAAREVRRRHPRARFVLVGGHDPSHPDAVCADQIARWRHEGAVTLVGHVEDMPRQYADADVFVLPSHREGRSMATMEAMASGLPVLTTRAPGCHDILDDGVEGLLSPVGDPHALARQMTELLVDPARAQAMGVAARQRALARYDARLTVPALLRILYPSPDPS